MSRRSSVKSVSWTDTNKAKFAEALLLYSQVKITDEVTEQIAAHIGKSGGHFKPPEWLIDSISGGDCKVAGVRNFIRNFLHKSKSKANGGAVAPLGPSRVAKAKASKTKSNGKKIKKEDDTDEGIEYNIEDQAAFTSPPGTPPLASMPTVLRSSPRDRRKVNYAKVEDPISDMHGFADEDGLTGNSSEDPAPSDVAYDGSEQEDDHDDDVLPEESVLEAA